MFLTLKEKIVRTHYDFIIPSLIALCLATRSSMMYTDLLDKISCRYSIPHTFWSGREVRSGGGLKRILGWTWNLRRRQRRRRRRRWRRGVECDVAVSKDT